MNKVDVKVKRLHPDAVIPKYSHLYDAGFDLVAVEDVIAEPGQTVKVRTGLSLEIPRGYELQIRPRSGVSSKTKLRVSNAPGTVDAGYRGEVCVLLDNTHQRLSAFEIYSLESQGAEFRLLDISGETIEFHGDGEFHLSYLIKKGDRIAQGVIAPVYQAQFEEVDELDETERGEGGFGSSGVKA